jgi:uncharacterized protein (TIGR02466 family)
MSEPSVDLFFGVPVLVQDVEPAVRDAIHAKVSAYLNTEAAKRTVEPSPEESVTTSYYKPGQSIVEDAGIDELADVVFGAARTFLEGRLGLPPRKLEIQQAWINLFEPGAQEGQHTHDGSLLSCSYYVEAPENCGCIVFPDPIGERRGYRHFTETIGKNLLTRTDIAIEPQPGRLVMFESWFGHSVQCNKSDRRRISIAINLRAASVEAGRRKTTAPAAVKSPGPVDRAEAATAPEAFDPAGRPYLFNELFDVESNLRLNMNPVESAIPTVVIDNVLKHPERVRETIGSMPAANWKHEAGGRNFVDYYDCRLRIPIRFPTGLISVAQKAIQQIYQLATRPADPSVDVNWFMQIKPKRADFAVPHADVTENAKHSLTCIVYLNSEDECSGGTAFLRFRQSGSLVIDEGYALAVRSDPSISETGLDYWPGRADELWERVGTVDMLPGRMLIFPSQFFHAAYHPKDSFLEFPRLTLAFWMIS